MIDSITQYWYIWAILGTLAHVAANARVNHLKQQGATKLRQRLEGIPYLILTLSLMALFYVSIVSYAKHLLGQCQ